MKMNEPTKEECKEAFRKALNRGDTDAAAKIALYAVLTPENADLFALSLISVAEAIMMAQEDKFKQEPEFYTRNGIRKANLKVPVTVDAHREAQLADLVRPWVIKEFQSSCQKVNDNDN
jgi:hypothetical protein